EGASDVGGYPVVNIVYTPTRTTTDSGTYEYVYGATCGSRFNHYYCDKSEYVSYYNTGTEVLSGGIGLISANQTLSIYAATLQNFSVTAAPIGSTGEIPPSG